MAFKGPKDHRDLIPDDEITGVHDQLGVYRKLEKLDGLLQKTVHHVSEIPAIKHKVDSTSDKVIELKTQMTGVDNRVDGVERRLERSHDCHQTEIINKLSENGKKSAAELAADIQNGIKTIEKINYVEVEVNEIKDSRKWLIGVVVGLIVPILGAIAGGAWFAADLTARVAVQEEVQRRQLERVQQTIMTSSQEHTKAIQVLDEQIEKASSVPDAVTVIKQQNWYKQLSITDRRRLDALIAKSSSSRSIRP